MPLKTIRMHEAPASHKFWELKNVADGQVDVYIYGDIIYEEDRWFYGEDDAAVSAVSLRDELAAAGDIDTINLYVKSFGGSFFEALAISAVLARHPATINAVVDGYAASAVTLVLAVADTVAAPPNSEFLYHAPIGLMWGYFNASELREFADSLDRLLPAMLSTYQMKVPTLTMDEMLEMFEPNDWITAQEAYDLGFVDVVMPDEMKIAACASAMLPAYAHVPEALEAALAKGVETEDDDGLGEDAELEIAESERQAEEAAAMRAAI